jgi:hypothetical protein
VIKSCTNAVWERRFAARNTRPEDEDRSGTWKNRLSWIKRLNPIRNEVSHGAAISEEDYAFLVDLREWLLSEESDGAV